MRTISVTGYGSATAVPDRAVVRITAFHRAPALSEALAGASSAGESVVAVARAHVESAAIGSRELNVWPAHDHEGRPAGFEARHSYVVGCPTLTVAGALVTDLADRVGDRLQVEGVSLEVGDPAGGVRNAREAAFADARSRAEHLAELASVTLGEVQTVIEGSEAGQGRPRAFKATADAVSFEPGESTLTESITVTWAVS